MSLNGKNVLITGAGRGIGKRLAIGFARRGAQVGLVSRTQVELDLVRMEIEYEGGHCLVFPGDIRCPDTISRIVAAMEEKFGPLDALVHSAGILAPIGPLSTLDPDRLHEALDTNLLGLVNACRAVLPGMTGRRQGKIVAIIGQGAFSGLPNFAVDTATQAGVARLVESLAEEVRLDNVQINCLTPGRTYSHMTDLVIEAGPDRAGREVWQEALQVQRTGGAPVERQVALAEFLCSENSNHISGKLLHIHDDPRKLAQNNMRPGLLTLRRSVLP